MSNEHGAVINRKPFDLQEAVILLDVYLLEMKNNISRTEASGIASDRLRNLAVKRGLVISDSFRSPMGLQNRLRSIEGIYKEGSPFLLPEQRLLEKRLHCIEMITNGINSSFVMLIHLHPVRKKGQQW